LITYILYGIFILSCIVMVISVLLQPGKADAGALFTSSVSSTAFGPRGTQTILAKITIGAAATFMIVALLLTMGVGGQSSLMEGKTKAKPTPTSTPAPQQGEGGATAPAGNAPATPAANTESNANSSNK
jgi:preprotein translocase subunit SecG